MEENKQGTGKPTIDKEYLKKLAEKIKAEKARKEAMQKKPGNASTPPPPPSASIPPTLLDDDDDDEDMAEEKTAIIDLSALSGHAADARLIIMDGKDEGKSIEITRDEIFSGRGLDNDFVITDPSVSRKHFKIEREDDHFCASDLGSGNGTRVNGSKITKVDLYHNDVIVAGARQIRFEIINEDMKAKWTRKEAVVDEEEIVTRKKSSPLAWVALFLILAGAVYMFYPEIFKTGPTKVVEAPWRLAIEDLDMIDGFIENKDLGSAEKKLTEFLKKAPDQKQLLERKELVEKEKLVQIKFNEAKTLFEQNKKDAAEKIFKDISEDSIFFDDIVEIVGDETVAKWNVETIKSLISDGKEDDAFTKIYAILSDDPENDEIKELQASLIEKMGQAKAEEMKKEAEEKKKAAAAAAASRRRARAQRTAARRSSAPARTAPVKTAPSKGGQSDFDQAISQYLSKNFDAAINSLDKAAQDKSVASKANEIKLEIQKFKRQWDRAAKTSGTRKSALVRRLVEYDRNISGGKMIKEIEALDKESSPPPRRAAPARTAPAPARKATMSENEVKTLYMRARSLRNEDPQQARELFQRIIDGTDSSNEYHEKSKRLLRSL